MEDTREEQWKQQRKERGFDNRELWSLDYTIAEFVLPRLVAFRKQVPDCPCGLTNKEWKHIISQMIWSFNELVNNEPNHPKGYNKEELDKYFKKYNEGFKLFGKYFCNLWY